MKLTKQRLAEIKAREEKATRGPWRNSKKNGIWANPEPTRASVFVCEAAHGKNDSAFIAAARTDIPDLIEALEEAVNILRALLETDARGQGLPWRAAIGNAAHLVARFDGEEP